MTDSIKLDEKREWACPICQRIFWRSARPFTEEWDEALREHMQAFHYDPAHLIVCKECGDTLHAVPHYWVHMYDTLLTKSEDYIAFRDWLVASHLPHCRGRN